MKTYLKKLILSGVAGVLLTPALHANINVTNFTVGGNATINLIQDRLTNSVGGILPGGTIVINSTNKLIFRATGTLNGTTNVVWDFNLTGGAGAIEDIEQQNTEVRADNTTGIPVNAISIVAPETLGIDSTVFSNDYTLIAPVVFVKNQVLAGTPQYDLYGITNITARQAYYLEAEGGFVPTLFFGGTNYNNGNFVPLYFVGRNSIAAVRQLTDAVVGFKGTASNWTTNSLGLPTKYLDVSNNPTGASSGSEVVGVVGLITNSIGTAAAQDAWGVSKVSILPYEGVAYSVSNVINGSYPLWGYERYIYYPSTGANSSKAPSPSQLALIKTLEAAVSNYTWQTNSTVFVNKFVSLTDIGNSVLQISRNVKTDNGAIIENAY